MTFTYKIAVTAVLACLCLPVAAISQSNDEWDITYVVERSLQDSTDMIIGARRINMINESVGYIFSISQGSRLHRTNDGWETTTVIEPDFDPIWYEAVGENTIYAITSGTLYKSDNAGQSWQSQSSLFGAFHDETNVQFSKISFYDENHGWIFGPNQAYYTSDGGESWQYNELETPQCFTSATVSTQISADHSRVSLYNENSAWILLDRIPISGGAPAGCSEELDYIYHTTNGGSSWDIVPLSDYASSVNFLNDRTGWVYGDSSPIDIVRKTTDGGQSFTNLPVNSPFGGINFWGSAVSDAPAGGAVIGNRQTGSLFDNSLRQIPHVFTTDNGGVTWDEYPIGELVPDT
ncbi:MAG: hypothetical protein LAT57_03410, partial [Balneolales bacterium]|nr:hypothetical protein [Balneolales bacterium]